MGLFGKDKDDSPSAGSTDGTTTGTPDNKDAPLAPPGHEQEEGMVVSGGGVATPSEDDATPGG